MRLSSGDPKETLAELCECSTQVFKVSSFLKGGFQRCGLGSFIVFEIRFLGQLSFRSQKVLFEELINVIKAQNNLRKQNKLKQNKLSCCIKELEEIEQLSYLRITQRKIAQFLTQLAKRTTTPKPNTNHANSITIQTYQFKYSKTNTPIQIHQYKYTNSNTPIQIYHHQVHHSSLESHPPDPSYQLDSVATADNTCISTNKVPTQIYSQINNQISTQTYLNLQALHEPPRKCPSGYPHAV